MPSRLNGRGETLERRARDRGVAPCPVCSTQAPLFLVPDVAPPPWAVCDGEQARCGECGGAVRCMVFEIVPDRPTGEPGPAA